jgi:hypothetical protein
MPESQTVDLAFMRELNERIVLNLIRQEGPRADARGRPGSGGAYPQCRHVSRHRYLRYNRLNPGWLVIDGTLAVARGMLLELAAATVRHPGSMAVAKHIAIIPGALADDDVALGVVALVVQHTFGTPSARHRLFPSPMLVKSLSPTTPFLAAIKCNASCLERNMPCRMR